SNFFENTVTWNNAPGISPTIYSKVITDADVDNFISIDITNIAIGWFNNTIPNFGITLVGIEDVIIDTLIGYLSNKACADGRRPFLSIVFNQGGTGGTGVTGATGATGATG
ncbi:DNRLRE domain-containing protein, partial [Clostridium sp. Maddingley MBC34-26]|uniref:DNRLRE domain-containing protein n=1 Tax=Clostridium sp. Maddingley MBC34-26 TaxID=1196322 RepID=UPI000297310C